MFKLFQLLTSGIPLIRDPKELIDGNIPSDASTASSSIASSSTASSSNPRITRFSYILSSTNPLKKVHAWVKIESNHGTDTRTDTRSESSRRFEDFYRLQLKKRSHLDSILSKIRNSTNKVYSLEYIFGPWKARYLFSPWIPNRVARRLLPFQIYVGKDYFKDSFLLSPDRKVGLRDITRSTSRIKSFGLGEAIIYSYHRDTRFVFTLAFLIGITVWWYTAPEALLLNPQSILLTPDPQLLTQVVKDTYIDAICSHHKLPSPCSLCNEPYNTVVRDLIKEPYQIDPLNLNQQGKLLGLSLLIGSIILGLALSESVTQYGVLESSFISP